MLSVVRGEDALSLEGRHVLDAMSSFRVESKLVSEWPGTVLHGHQATLSTYTLTPALGRIIKEAANSLFSWQHPNLPEDLCLRRADGTPWLVTIAHESDGYLELTDLEHRDLVQRLPEIERYLQTEQ